MRPDCPSDVNEDRVVDVNDLLALLGHFGATLGPRAPPAGLGDGASELSRSVLSSCVFSELFPITMNVSPAGAWASFHAALQASDINGDGAVGVDDLLTLLSDYGGTC